METAVYLVQLSQNTTLLELPLSQPEILILSANI